jgi:hypothetical protein
MKQIILVLTLSLALAGCAHNADGSLVTSIPNPVTNTQLATLESAYGVALAGAVAYRNRPRCTKTALESVSNICARRSIVIRMQQADKTAQVAIGRARGFVIANPTLDASSLIQAAQDAIAVFSQIQTGAL